MTILAAKIHLENITAVVLRYRQPVVLMACIAVLIITHATWKSKLASSSQPANRSALIAFNSLIRMMMMRMMMRRLKGRRSCRTLSPIIRRSYAPVRQNARLVTLAANSSVAIMDVVPI
jgi:hypothetical protein